MWCRQSGLGAGAHDAEHVLTRQTKLGACSGDVEWDKKEGCFNEVMRQFDLGEVCGRQENMWRSTPEIYLDYIDCVSSSFYIKTYKIYSYIKKIE